MAGENGDDPRLWAKTVMILGSSLALMASAALRIRLSTTCWN